MQIKTLVNGVQNMNHKIIKFTRFVGNSHVYQTPKSNCFIAAGGIGTRKALFSVQIYLLWKLLEIKIIGPVNPNTPYSPPVCRMFNEIVKYLKSFIFIAGVTIMTSASKWWRHRQSLAWYLDGVDLNLGCTPEVLLSIFYLLSIRTHGQGNYQYQIPSNWIKSARR